MIDAPLCYVPIGVLRTPFRMRSDGVYAAASTETGDTAVRGEGEK